MEYCWAHADVVAQHAEGDRGYYRRLECHTGYLRKDHAEVYEAVAALVARVREARACATAPA